VADLDQVPGQQPRPASDLQDQTVALPDGFEQAEDARRAVGRMEAVALVVDIGKITTVIRRICFNMTIVSNSLVPREGFVGRARGEAAPERTLLPRMAWNTGTARPDLPGQYSPVTQSGRRRGRSRCRRGRR
jgi:hypothetical protein